jgi:hypothetical protein
VRAIILCCRRRSLAQRNKTRFRLSMAWLPTFRAGDLLRRMQAYAEFCIRGFRHPYNLNDGK